MISPPYPWNASKITKNDCTMEMIESTRRPKFYLNVYVIYDDTNDSVIVENFLCLWNLNIKWNLSINSQNNSKTEMIELGWKHDYKFNSFEYMNGLRTWVIFISQEGVVWKVYCIIEFTIAILK